MKASSPVSGGKTQSGTYSNNNATGSDWRLVTRDTFANTFNLVGDWAYYFAISKRDFTRETDDELAVEFDPNHIIHAVLAFCIVSTLFYLLMVATSIGRKCAKKNSVCFKCSMNRLMFAEIIVEDVPQFFLTAYIDYYFSGGLTPAGMLNICSSLNALVNRATARYEDIEEEKKEEAAGKYQQMS